MCICVPMDVEIEQVKEQTDIPAAPTEKTAHETKNRDRGVKGRGRGGRMGRGGRGMMKAFGLHGRGRGRGHEGLMNGFGPMRRGMGRMRPYTDFRGRGGMRGGPRGLGPPPPPPPPLHLRPYHPMLRHGPPPHPLHGPPCFRGRPPPPRGHSGPPGPPRHFHPRGGALSHPFQGGAMRKQAFLSLSPPPLLPRPLPRDVQLWSLVH
ncbi:pre-mRNA 3' end processing protein WDR33 isoform X1 [Alosa alosa]|uniref:pre-mRNA 3' end processing protein WDR33 isoform X1 n=1 Tax=Alosa alosa TaxID=278164 RepID=UPI0020150D71|nr:pre-mRNA 3' end processing protein WDR33 isoform X1 [Alosa alosa]XP_048107329.1 pre-mRNA 3' end processing protein WDR33 isoform X1 [Alosa alosa]XP_048107330.1 pre-mRNA 3' end processing protein WDR33 isoform X1 [Alosa alosa]XP_048107331.1 pre-mRNA 3' end processing protein WDR33 isoform X1 [Alosa alosa]XP_048107332.1 pre-mRNA 3' end processing protein WDR33 isoform X1 [Alosa alosa]